MGTSGDIVAWVSAGGAGHGSTPIRVAGGSRGQGVSRSRYYVATINNTGALIFDLIRHVITTVALCSPLLACGVCAPIREPPTHPLYRTSVFDRDGQLGPPMNLPFNY